LIHTSELLATPPWHAFKFRETGPAYERPEAYKRRWATVNQDVPRRMFLAACRLPELSRR
jgi:hypothetical protein